MTPGWGRSFEIAIADITIDRETRQRREIETEDLEASIRQRGLIQPIVIEGAKAPFRLVAGERRLTACKNLGLTVIEARSVSDLSQIERELLELEENIKRQDLTWQEITRAVAKVHQLHQAQDSEWTLGESAQVCGLAISTVSLYLRVNAEINSNERIADAGTAREAYNILTRRDQRAAGAAMEELIRLPPAPRPKAAVETPQPGEVSTEMPPAAAQPMIVRPTAPAGPPSVEETILNASFLDWAPSYSGPRFNFIHCDFPYGIDFAAGPQGQGNEIEVYDDSRGVYFKLLDCLLDNLDKLMASSAHMVFWYSEAHGPATREAFATRAPTLKLLRHPLIWLKSDNAGITPDTRRTPRHVYETAMLLVRGDRQLVRVKADAYASPTNKTLHPSTKPEPMLRHFFEMLVDDHTIMLDPTAGSGAALRAAESLRAKSVLGLEIDPQYLGPARKALGDERKKRVAEALVRGSGAAAFGL
jgi:ParB/RepB/Spo0J family partition protein